VRRGSGEVGKRGRLGVSTFLLLCMGTGILNAEPTSPLPIVPTSPPDTALAVYLMTMGPGKRVWERFGHNAIWIHDPVAGTDQAYNYGLFDFRQQNFLLRFIQGRMWYWMDGAPASAYLESYRRANRSVWVQELEIPPDARRELQRFLIWNERPENRYYHYDYYRDNCSTRVRDALDRALGGLIRRETDRVPAGTTYRFHTQRLTANDPPTFTGLLLALGHPVDRPISKWEEMFLPLAMRVHLRNLTVTKEGRSVPLVRSEQTLFQSTEPDPPAAPPDWTSRYLAIGAVLGGVMALLGWLASAGRGPRLSFLLFVSAWLLLAGIAGVVLAGLWAFTDHAAAYQNENVLQANLLALPLLWFMIRLTLGKGAGGNLALGLSVALALISLLGLMLKPLPFFYQVNGPIIALALPLHLGTAIAAWSLQRDQGPTRRAASRASG